MILDEYISQLEKIDIRSPKLEIAKAIKKKIPEIDVQVSKYKHMAGPIYSSATINSMANQVEFDIIDNQLFCWFFLELALSENDGPPLAKIYTSPAGFSLGKINPKGFGIIPAKNWKGHLEERKMSKEVISIVQDYFFDHQPVVF